MQNTTVHVEFIIKNLHLEESNWKATDVTILLLKYHLINKQEAYPAFIISFLDTKKNTKSSNIAQNHSPGLLGSNIWSLFGPIHMKSWQKSKLGQVGVGLNIAQNHSSSL